jgi:methenyltetrahydrofolate cyclohydrolase
MSQVNVEAFLKVLDTEDNSTGGGTASAVAGAMAASLLAMVARLSIGKKDMKPEAFYEDIAANGAALSLELMEGSRADSQSFEGVRNAFRLPKETPEEKTARSKAIQTGWVHATRVPLANAQGCARALTLAAQLSEAYNTNAASDLECASHLARAGLKGCIANIEINLPAIKDEQIVAEITQLTAGLKVLF